MENPTTILGTDYKALPISPAFKRFFAVYKIENLEALLAYKPKDLIEMKWFTERLLKEYVDLLDENGLIERIE